MNRAAPYFFQKLSTLRFGPNSDRKMFPQRSYAKLSVPSSRKINDLLPFVWDNTIKKSSLYLQLDPNQGLDFSFVHTNLHI